MFCMSFNFLKSYSNNDSTGSGFYCFVCGGTSFEYHKIIWKELARDWQLSPFELEYINLQQGKKCSHCHSNMRSNVLAHALIEALASKSQSLHQLTLNEYHLTQEVSILEVNAAGTLGQYLEKFAKRCQVEYPEYNMHGLDIIAKKFDIVIHSDTLEHVPNPVHALSQCKDILRDGGSLIYTVPVIVGRMSRDRTGLSDSSHSKVSRLDYRVATEFGADFWRFPLDAGFSNIQIHTIDFPVAVSITATT